MPEGCSPTPRRPDERVERYGRRVVLLTPANKTRIGHQVEHVPAQDDDTAERVTSVWSFSKRDALTVIACVRDGDHRRCSVLVESAHVSVWHSPRRPPAHSFDGVGQVVAPHVGV